LLIYTNTNKKPLVAIIGPTGTGKSSLAIDLASIFKGEIVNADSRQVYRYMDIGTAKPSSIERGKVPHHLFDIIDPNHDFGLAQYLELARPAIQDIHERDNIPFLVGGSGQYVWSILEGWEIPRIPPNVEFRSSLEAIAAQGGENELYDCLVNIDPVSAQKIDKRNVRRVIRALEVTQIAEKPFSQLKIMKAPDYNILIIGLTAERTTLYQKVDFRVESMFANGLEAEATKLENMGYNFQLPSMNSIGYKQIGVMRRDMIDRDKTIQNVKVDTHRFIRHQYSWFSLRDKRIIWFDNSADVKTEIITLIANHISMD
jgi:tRNA dimethylallyltransferase